MISMDEIRRIKASNFFNIRQFIFNLCSCGMLKLGAISFCELHWKTITVIKSTINARKGKYNFQEKQQYIGQCFYCKFWLQGISIIPEMKNESYMLSIGSTTRVVWKCLELLLWIMSMGEKWKKKDTQIRENLDLMIWHCRKIF